MIRTESRYCFKCFSLTSLLASIFVLSGCAWGNGSVGPGISPGVKERYEVSGRVSGHSLGQAPIPDATVSVLDGEKVVNTTQTTSDGRFHVRIGASRDKPYIKESNSTLSQNQSKSVAHLTVGVQTHDHWIAKIRIEADGYITQEFPVDVPIPIDSPEPVFNLQPVPSVAGPSAP